MEQTGAPRLHHGLPKVKAPSAFRERQLRPVAADGLQGPNAAPVDDHAEQEALRVRADPVTRWSGQWSVPADFMED